MTNIVKEFPGVKALDGVNLDFMKVSNGLNGRKWSGKIYTYENIKWSL